MFIFRNVCLRLGAFSNRMRTDLNMQNSQSAQRRIYVLCRILKSSQKIQINYVNGRIPVNFLSTGEGQVKIGEVSKFIKEPKVPQYVPIKYLEAQPSQEVLSHLRWMLQKDVLGQDVFLIGRPGPLRRRLVMQYLEMTAQEAEYVALSRDTTEADLKQRREIRAGTAHYFDQSAVRAAVEGRVLVLEGIEKAERNVLPVLNNLLENREMRLEDGRFLIPAKRYDHLLQEHGQEEVDRWQLVRVSENFRVVALGLPTPRYPGNPLDPPLRSRFQARHVDSLGFQEQLLALRSSSPEADPARISQLLSCGYALLTGEAASLGLPDFPIDSLSSAATLLTQFPWLSPLSLLYRHYPYHLFLPEEGCRAVEDILRTFQLLQEGQEVKLASTDYVENVSIGGQPHNAAVRLSSGQHTADVQVCCGSEPMGSAPIPNQLVPTPYQEGLVAAMLESHAVGADLCLVGPRGCGKSAAVQRLAHLLQYHIEPVLLYQDMTSRDLVQQRTTLPSGDTAWRNSPLVDAALFGKLAVLDGLHRLHPSTLAVLHRLVQDRELTLFDGRRLVRHDRYDEYKQRYNLTDEQLAASGMLKVHPAFRVVAIAEPPALKGGSRGQQWLSSELLSLFLFHEVRPLEAHEELHIISELYGADTNKAMASVVQLAHKMRQSPDPTLRSLSGSLSTRQLLRIARRLAQYPNDNPRSAIQQACLSRFLPPLARQLLERTLDESGFPPEETVLEDGPLPTCKVSADSTTVRVGNTQAQRYHGAAVSQVPDVLFFDIPQHVRALELLLQDFELGEHLLLVGNQGVGKNKLADRLLQLLGRPRQYIQLHRDTTVQTLTLQPTVREGIVTYEDSPLVTAARLGHVLVVDEADKAPTHVTCILKTLVETGEMALSDGRRIVPVWNRDRGNDSIIPLHPDFRIIVLANRPGFPFLGNDFFGALGDLFSCHAIDNPSPQSETSLLRRYGPNVSEEIIGRLVRAFGELRYMADRGLLQYPYSTREVVNIVNHLQEFPEEGLTSVVRNVFDFDHYSQEVQDTILQTLRKHGIPVGAKPGNVHLAKEFPLHGPRLAAQWITSTNKQQLRVEERPLRTYRPDRVAVRRHQVDVVQARGAAFSELRSYWQLPLQATTLVSGLTVTKDPEGEVSRDMVHALLSNPLSLMTMQPLKGDDYVHEVSLQGFFSPVRGARPRYSLATVQTTANYVLVHEQSSNGAVLVDHATGEVHRVSLSVGGVYEEFGNLLGLVSGSAGPTHWRLLPSLLPVHHTAVFYEEGGYRAEVVNFENLTSYFVKFPVKIHSLHIIDSEHWLIEDADDRQYVANGSPCPDVLMELQQTGSGPGTTLAVGAGAVPTVVVSRALPQSVDGVSSGSCRLMATSDSAAALAVDFPGSSRAEILTWGEAPNRMLGSPVLYADRGQIIRAVPATQVPSEISPEGNSIPAAFLEVTDIVRSTQRYIPVPRSSSADVSSMASWIYSTTDPPLFMAATSDGGVATLDAAGCVQLWEMSIVSLEKSVEQWRKMIGPGREYLQMTVDKPSGKDVTAPKHGKVDETGAPHVGGNTWAGGTGGRDTAGLGGKGGPYRLDAGHPVHQVSQEEKDAVPEHVKQAAREMARRAFQQRLREIQMSEYDAKLYSEFSNAVSHQVQMLRVMLSSLQAKAKERQWVRHQTAGELDDTKLIEGLTGEKTIFRRRADMDPEPGSPQTKPKRLRLVVDVSGSMYRFNSYDGRLDRELEAVVMVMEAFEGHQDRIQYDIVGHSGEEFDLIFVDHKMPPTDNKKRLDIIKTMHAHSQFCMSGDHTLAATRHAVESLSREDCDEAMVVVLSDANLERYRIPPEEFAAALTSHPNVGAYAIFIGSLGDQAQRLAKSLPSGRAFICLDLKNIPQILQQIFSSSVLSGH